MFSVTWICFGIHSPKSPVFYASIMISCINYLLWLQIIKFLCEMNWCPVYFIKSDTNISENTIIYLCFSPIIRSPDFTVLITLFLLSHPDRAWRINSCWKFISSLSCIFKVLLILMIFPSHDIALLRGAQHLLV